MRLEAAYEEQNAFMHKFVSVEMLFLFAQLITQWISHT